METLQAFAPLVQLALLLLACLVILALYQRLNIITRTLKRLLEHIGPLIRLGIQAFHPSPLPVNQNRVNLATELTVALNEVLGQWKIQHQQLQTQLSQLQRLNTLFGVHALTLKGYLNLSSLCLSNLGYGIRVLNEHGDILFENDMFHRLSAPWGSSFSATLALAIRNIATPKEENLYTLRRRHATLRIQVTSLHLPESDVTLSKGILVVLEDVTAQEMLKAQLIDQERWSAIGDMSAQISHEIRNPLSAMVMNLELLQEDLSQLSELPAQVPQLLHNLTRQTERLLTFSDRYLKLHRLFEASGPFNPHLIIEDALSSLFPIAERKNIVLRYQKTQHPITLQGDPQALYTIVHNVIQNALDAMNSGTLTLQTRLYGSKHFVLRIKDEGPGIPSAHRREIFKPFFTTKKEGTGLGLALVKRATDHLQGTCHLICGQNTRGTLFVFHFERQNETPAHVTSTSPTVLSPAQPQEHRG